jgi:hypothetical protein
MVRKFPVLVLAFAVALCAFLSVQCDTAEAGGLAFRTPVRNALAFGFAPRVVAPRVQVVAPFQFRQQFVVPHQQLRFVQPLQFNHGVQQLQFGHGVQRLNFGVGGYGGQVLQFNGGYGVQQLGVGSCLVH